MWILVETDEVFGDTQIFTNEEKKEQLKKIEKRHLFEVWHTIVTLERKVKKEANKELKIVDVATILSMLTPAVTKQLVSKSLN